LPAMRGSMKEWINKIKSKKDLFPNSDNPYELCMIKPGNVDDKYVEKFKATFNQSIPCKLELGVHGTKGECAEAIMETGYRCSKVGAASDKPGVYMTQELDLFQRKFSAVTGLCQCSLTTGADRYCPEGEDGSKVLLLNIANKDYRVDTQNHYLVGTKMGTSEQPVEATCNFCSLWAACCHCTQYMCSLCCGCGQSGSNLDDDLFAPILPFFQLIFYPKKIKDAVFNGQTWIGVYNDHGGYRYEEFDVDVHSIFTQFATKVFGIYSRSGLMPKQDGDVDNGDSGETQPDGAILCQENNGVNSEPRMENETNQNCPHREDGTQRESEQADIPIDT